MKFSRLETLKKYRPHCQELKSRNATNSKVPKNRFSFLVLAKRRKAKERKIML